MRNMITIKEVEGKELERRVSAKTVAVRERQRAQIVVLAIGGRKQGQIAAEVGVSSPRASTAEAGIAGKIQSPISCTSCRP
jgi:hypothetical protein